MIANVWSVKRALVGFDIETNRMYHGGVLKDQKISLKTK